MTTSVSSLTNTFIISPYKRTVSDHIDYIGADIVIKASNTEFFIPTICIPYAVDLYNLNRDIVIPFSIARIVTRKTTPAIIELLNASTNNICEFTKIDTTKGYIYYGSRGVILDNNYKSLMLCGYIVKTSTDNYEYIEPVCYISPKVFSQSDSISKFIINKAIPYYSNLEVTSGSDDNNISCLNHNIKIIISSDIDNIIHKAEAPLSADVDDTMYDILNSVTIDFS